ncbi:MAG TPA: hypothetical protein VMT62_08450 [Syntrophorhabdaceae bacterium]|nr:hypothetical protein [Syntrophorhabdaceae bacterium]
MLGQEQTGTFYAASVTEIARSAGQGKRVMRKRIMAFGIMLIGLACIGNTFAQTLPPMDVNREQQGDPLWTQGNANQKPETKRFSGKVVAVDASSQTIVLRNSRGEETFNTGHAKLVRHVELQDIKPGDRALVSYVEKEGKKTAEVVVATPAGQIARAKPASSGIFDR